MKKVLKAFLLISVLLMGSSLGFADEPATVGVTIDATATIPTFVRFTLGDWSAMINPGLGVPGVQYSSSPSLNFSHSTGYMDGSWKLLSATAEPDQENVYIPSNTLTAAIVANCKYTYYITGSSLTYQGDPEATSLPIEFMYEIDGTKSDTKSLNGEHEILTNDAPGRKEITHRFRVPYSLEYLAGTYRGQVTFKVVVM